MSAAIDRRRGGGRPLDGEVLRRMQSGFSADLSAVRVHDDPESARLNRLVGARAFTTGSDIFFGSGQFAPGTSAGDRVLAHEIAHTLQDEAPVRREIDVTTRATATTITAVEVEGRPRHTFGSSMGDHSTAFKISILAVRNALRGQPLTEAGRRLGTLYDQVKALPGWGMLGNLAADRAVTWATVKAGFETALAAVQADGGQTAPNIDAAVEQFLELRELVPLSVVDVGKARSKALAGKGHGERTEALEAFAAGGIGATTVDAVRGDILSCFDEVSAATACIQLDAGLLQEVALGLGSDRGQDRPEGAERHTLAAATMADVTDLAEDFADQHLQSIEMAFPGALAALPGGRAALLASIVATIEATARTEIAGHVRALQDSITSQTTQHTGLMANLAIAPKRSQKKILRDIAKLITDLGETWTTLTDWQRLGGIALDAEPAVVVAHRAAGPPAAAAAELGRDGEAEEADAKKVRA